MTNIKSTVPCVPLYAIYITHGFNSVKSDDLYRAEEAIDASLAKSGITTPEQFKDCLMDYVARTEGGDHNAKQADIYEGAVSAGDIALTMGWHNPDGASISLGC